MEEKTMTLRELVAEAAALLSQEGLDQPSGRVSDVPTVRTVRYYATHGLLEKPVDWRGRSALYGPRHLLLLLAIKRLQARGETLQDVQDRLAGIRDDELEELAGVTYEELVSDGEEDDEGDEYAGEEAKREDRAGAFWMERPTQVSPEVAVKPVSEGEIRGARLDEDVVLLLERAQRGLDASDVAAIKAAAQPLLRLLRARHIIEQ
ncbi:unnamed protein product [Laminaria digitata]